MRVLLPVVLVGLGVGLALSAYANLGGEPASYEAPYTWVGGPVFLAGGPSGDGVTAYAECLTTPAEGEVRVVRVSSGGVMLESWFTGSATITCGRSVSVTSGPQVLLYPFALKRSILLGLAAAAVLLCWCGYRLNVASGSGSRR